MHWVHDTTSRSHLCGSDPQTRHGRSRLDPTHAERARTDPSWEQPAGANTIGARIPESSEPWNLRGGWGTSAHMGDMTLKTETTSHKLTTPGCRLIGVVWGDSFEVPPRASLGKTGLFRTVSALPPVSCARFTLRATHGGGVLLPYQA